MYYREKRGFTLVEMLFVVIIAAILLGFALPGYQKMRENVKEKGATGFLAALANAKEAFVRDLNSQGIIDPWQDNGTPWENLDRNIEVTMDNKTSDTSGSWSTHGLTLSQFLDDHGFSGEAINQALYGFNYLRNVNAAPAGYHYCLYLGFPVNHYKCGSLHPDKESKMLAYMCKDPTPLQGVHASVSQDPLDKRCYLYHSWAYLSDGSILSRTNGRPDVKEGTTNYCSEVCDMSKEEDKNNPSCYDTYPSPLNSIDPKNKYKLAHFSCTRVGGDRAFTLVGPKSRYKYTVKTPMMGWTSSMTSNEPPIAIAFSADGYECSKNTSGNPFIPEGWGGCEELTVETEENWDVGDEVHLPMDHPRYGYYQRTTVLVTKKQEIKTWHPNVSCEQVYNHVINGTGTMPEDVVNVVISPQFRNKTPDAFEGVVFEKNVTTTSHDLDCSSSLPIGTRHYCTVWCKNLDVTAYNNAKSDEVDGDTEIEVDVDTWTDTTMSCYNYWHYHNVQGNLPRDEGDNLC